MEQVLYELNLNEQCLQVILKEGNLVLWNATTHQVYRELPHYEAPNLNLFHPSFSWEQQLRFYYYEHQILVSQLKTNKLLKRLVAREWESEWQELYGPLYNALTDINQGDRLCFVVSYSSPNLDELIPQIKTLVTHFQHVTTILLTPRVDGEDALIVFTKNELIQTVLGLDGWLSLVPAFKPYLQEELKETLLQVMNLTWSELFLEIHPFLMLAQSEIYADGSWNVRPVSPPRLNRVNPEIAAFLLNLPSGHTIESLLAD